MTEYSYEDPSYRTFRWDGTSYRPDTEVSMDVPPLGFDIPDIVTKEVNGTTINDRNAITLEWPDGTVHGNVTGPWHKRKSTTRDRLKESCNHVCKVSYLTNKHGDFSSQVDQAESEYETVANASEDLERDYNQQLPIGQRSTKETYTLQSTVVIAGTDDPQDTGVTVDQYNAAKPVILQLIGKSRELGEIAYQREQT